MRDEGQAGNGADLGPRAAMASPVQVALAEAVSLTLEVYLGEARMSLARFNELSSGGVIELDAALNASVEVRLNGVRVAAGELVAVGDHFGVRVTHLAK